MSQEEFTFTRKKSVTVHLTEGGITVAARMADGVHEMEVDLDVSIHDMVIRDVRGRMIKTPHEHCKTALASLKGAVGLEIKRGLSQLMEETIGGRLGCSHLTNLVMEACYVSIPGQYLFIRHAFGDILDEMTPAERTRWFIMMRPQMIDSCVAYSADSPLIEEAKRAPETQRIKGLIDRVATVYEGLKDGGKKERKDR